MTKGSLAIVSIVLLVLTTSCVSWVDRMMTSWMGYSISDLIASWGPPQETFDLGEEGKIYTWAEVKIFSGSMTTTTTHLPSGGSRTSYTPQSTLWLSLIHISEPTRL